MRTFALLVLSAAAPVLAGGLLPDRPVTVDPPDMVLQYDDDDPDWMCWTGTYRGVWFNLDDFGLGLLWRTDSTQLWFFHHSSYPWDTASFYCELYNGDQSGPVPVGIIDQTSLSALHYQPVYAGYSPALLCGSDFWVVVNTEMSSGGWPALLSDGSANLTAHSFHSADFQVWEPWEPDNAPVDFLIRSSGMQTALESATWGSIKTLF